MLVYPPVEVTEHLDLMIWISEWILWQYSMCAIFLENYLICLKYVITQVFLHLACNRLENLAENIQALVELKILIVEGNCLHSLPKALCYLTR